MKKPPMHETYYVGVYWWARRETAPECAQRAKRYFQALKQCDPSLGEWDRPGRPPRRVNTEDELELEKLLLRNRVRTDGEKRIVDDLGFGLSVFTPRTVETSIMIQCGVYTPHSLNSCWLDPPYEGTTANRLLSASVLARILTSMVLAWDPDWGIATSHQLRELIPEQEPKELPVGWLMYFSHRHGRVPPLPAPVRIEPIEDKGVLVTLTPERMTASNPEHIELVKRAHRLLQRAGLLVRPCAPPEPYP